MLEPAGVAAAQVVELRPVEMTGVDPGSLVTVVPAPPRVRDALDVAGLDGLIDGDAWPGPDERLARVLVETRALVVEWARLGRVSRPELRWRAATVADRLDAVLVEVFEGVG